MALKEANEEVKPLKQNTSAVKRKEKLYLHFTLRVVLYCTLFVLLVVGFIISTDKAFSFVKNDDIIYRETGTYDYKVYLKDNSFYDTPYLEEGMAYVTSLIDYIKIKYNYVFFTSVESDVDIQYRMIAKLVITSQNNSNVFYEKDYVLTKTVIDEMRGENRYVIDKDVEIDYQYYNDLANQFKSSYAVNTTSRLDVILEVEEKNQKTNLYDLRSASKTVVSIPLSEQEINISLDGVVNKEKHIAQDSKFVVDDITFVFVSGIIIILLFIVLKSLARIILLVLGKEKSEYDRYVRRLLLEYDRIIINVKVVPNKSDYNVIEVENFEELVDVRDNTKEPINYHVIEERVMSEFFVINDQNMYLYTVKAIDFNEKKDKK